MNRAKSRVLTRNDLAPRFGRAMASMLLAVLPLASSACGDERADEHPVAEQAESADAISAVNLGFCAAIFEHGGFTGTARYFRASEAREVMTDLNDRVSSVIVGPGCAVDLFDDPRFAGAAVRHFAGYHAWLQRPDVASSLRCACPGAATPAETPANVSGWAFSPQLPSQSLPILKGIPVDISNTPWNDHITGLTTHPNSPVRGCADAGFRGECFVAPGGVSIGISSGDVSTLSGLPMNAGPAGTRVLLGRLCDAADLRRDILGSESADCPVASGPIVHYNTAVFTTAQAASDFVGHALGTQFELQTRDANQTVVRVANGTHAIVGRIFFDHVARRFTRVELY